MGLTETVNSEQVAVEKQSEPYIYMVEFSRDTNLSRIKRAAIRFTNPTTLFPFWTEEEGNAKVKKISENYFVDQREFEVIKLPILTDLDRRYEPLPTAYKNRN